MNHHLRLIFLCTTICYSTGIDATFGDTMYNKTKQVYAFVCNKTRALYEKAKEHKKLIAGATACLMGIGYYIRNLKGQLHNADANIANLNNITIPGLNNQIVNLQNAHRQAQNQLITAQLQAQELQINIAHLERQNQHNLNDHQQVRQTLQQQLAQAQQQSQQLQAQVTQLNQDNETRIQVQERLLREDREESHRRAFEQGRAQAMLNYEHNAILQVFDNLEYALQVGQDPVGIVQNLMLQVPRLEFCSRIAVYSNQQEKLSNTFNRLVALTQNAIGHVIGHINGALVSLENNVKTMHFTGITADNFEQNFAHIQTVIHNYFGQLNYAFNQLGTLVGFSANNQIIRSHLANCDSDSILRPLYARLVSSVEKVQQLGSGRNGNIIVKSHDDAFNLYVHNEVAKNTYQSYIQFCSMMLEPEYYLNWVREFEWPLNIIDTRIQNGLVQVLMRAQEPSFNGVSSEFSNGSSLKSLNKSTLNISGFNFDQPVVNNSDVDEFFSNPVQSVVKINELQQSLMDRSRFGNNSMVASSVVQSTINLDDLQKLMFEGFEKDRNDFLNSNMGSSSMAQSTNNAHSKSCINLDDLLNVEFERLEKNTNDFLSSNVGSSVMAQSTYDSINLADKTGLSDSVIGFVDAVESSCSCVPSEKWMSAQEKLAQSGRFDNRGGFSRVADFSPKAYVNGWQASGVHSGQVRHNNINSQESNIVSNSIIENYENDALRPSDHNVESTRANNASPFGYSDLINELGTSTSVQSTTTAISTTDPIFVAQKELYERNEQEKKRLEEEQQKQQEEQKNAVVEQDVPLNLFDISLNEEFQSQLNQDSGEQAANDNTFSSRCNIQ